VCIFANKCTYLQLSRTYGLTYLACGCEVHMAACVGPLECKGHKSCNVWAGFSFTSFTGWKYMDKNIARPSEFCMFTSGHKLPQFCARLKKEEKKLRTASTWYTIENKCYKPDMNNGHTIVTLVYIKFHTCMMQLGVVI
jgi:hypothetical protein